MQRFRITTASGSTYVVGPTPAGHVRLSRTSDHVVRGTLGPLHFVEDFLRVEFVSDGTVLRLQCTALDGTTFTTSPLRDIAHDEAYDTATSPSP